MANRLGVADHNKDAAEKFDLTPRPRLKQPAQRLAGLASRHAAQAIRRMRRNRAQARRRMPGRDREIRVQQQRVVRREQRFELLCSREQDRDAGIDEHDLLDIRIYLYDNNSMENLLSGLRACAEPTRLRLLALVARGTFCVMEFTEILGQSQPRLSRHLRLLGEAGLLDRVREGANVWFALPPPETPGGRLARAVLAQLPDDDPLRADDARHAARVLAERARIASDSFRRTGADWDEMRALDLPAAAVEQALQASLPEDGIGRLLDIGTGTGRLLELLAPRVTTGLGIDASRAMLALARARLAAPPLMHCAVRLADMYRLPLPDGGFDVVVMQMVLHYAEDPAGALNEAARVLRPQGRLLVVDLAAHDSAECRDRFAHRWPGFEDERMHGLLSAAGLAPGVSTTIPGKLDVRIWAAARLADPLSRLADTQLEDAAR